MQLVGAGLILLGIAMMIAVVAVGVAVLLAKQGFRRCVNRLLHEEADATPSG